MVNKELEQTRKHINQNSLQSSNGGGNLILLWSEWIVGECIYTN